jgi:hypothetical protein
MADSHDLLLIFGFGDSDAGYSSYRLLHGLSSQRNQSLPTATYVQVPNTLREN